MQGHAPSWPQRHIGRDGARRVNWGDLWTGENNGASCSEKMTKTAADFSSATLRSKTTKSHCSIFGKGDGFVSFGRGSISKRPIGEVLIVRSFQ
jgi:hypothetical protein